MPSPTLWNNHTHMHILCIEYCTQTVYILLLLSFIYIEPSTTVLGGSEVFVGMGSTINLTCVIRLSPEPPNSIRWQHNNQVSRGTCSV
jgi:hypothetical protein